MSFSFSFLSQGNPGTNGLTGAKGATVSTSE
jgi:hypothetical protein